jgi:hypothetical protein
VKKYIIYVDVNIYAFCMKLDGCSVVLFLSCYLSTIASAPGGWHCDIWNKIKQNIKKPAFCEL